jgi:hypothetical protein
VTREDHDRIEHLASTVPLRSDGEVLARLLKERNAMLALLVLFNHLDTDPHATDAEWSQFRRDLHGLFRSVQYAEEG